MRRLLGSMSGPIPVSEKGCNQTTGISQVLCIMLLVVDVSGVVATLGKDGKRLLVDSPRADGEGILD